MFVGSHERPMDIAIVGRRQAGEFVGDERDETGPEVRPSSTRFSL